MEDQKDSAPVAEAVMKLEETKLEAKTTAEAPATLKSFLDNNFVEVDSNGPKLAEPEDIDEQPERIKSETIVQPETIEKVCEKFLGQVGGLKIQDIDTTRGVDAFCAGLLEQPALFPNIIEVSDGGVSGHRRQKWHLLTTLLSEPKMALMTLMALLSLASASRQVPDYAPPAAETSRWSEKDILTYVGTAILIGLSVIGVVTTIVTCCCRGHSPNEHSSNRLEEGRRPLCGTLMFNINIYGVGSPEASPHHSD